MRWEASMEQKLEPQCMQPCAEFTEGEKAGEDEEERETHTQRLWGKDLDSLILMLPVWKVFYLP